MVARMTTCGKEVVYIERLGAQHLTVESINQVIVSTALILQSLPATCVNVEIDSSGYDLPHPESDHLCDILRQIIPRLRHLSLRLRHLCPAILGSGCYCGRGRMKSKGATGTLTYSTEELAQRRLIGVTPSFREICTLRHPPAGT